MPLVEEGVRGMSPDTITLGVFCIAGTLIGLPLSQTGFGMDHTSGQAP